MWRVILLVFCYHVVSQPVTEDPPTRHTRELIECCPCPGSSHGGQDMVGRSLGRSADDCPCRVRSADSEGASSILFPTKTAGNPYSVPFMRSNDPNDMKNLLEPEVGLAKSMLQTLREATEEDYRDALARDAARSSDAVPEESAKNVVIIVKPRSSVDEDDFVSEASNVKEARCINPVGSLGRMRTASKPLRTLPDLLRFPIPKQSNFMPRNLWDMDSNVGASNVHEDVLGANRPAADFKPRSPLFKFRTPLKENTFVSDVLKTPLTFNKLENTLKNRPNLFQRLNLPLIPKMKVDNPLQKENDHQPAPSNTQELIEKEEGRFNYNKRPLMLKNLLKLKDVELVPKTIPRMPIFKSKLNNKDTALPSLRDANDDTKCTGTNNDSTTDKVVLPKMVLNNSEENFEAKAIPNVDTDLKKIESSVEENQEDAITSPSEISPNFLDNSQMNTIELVKTNCDDLPLEGTLPTTTESIANVLEFDDTLDAAVESKIYEITENNNDSNINKDYETDEISEHDVEVTEPSVDSSNNIESVTPFTSEENPILQPQIQEPKQVSEPVSTIPFDDCNGGITNNHNEQETQSIELKPSETSNKINSAPPLSETWSTVKDNIKKSFENLKKTLPKDNNRNSQLNTDSPIIQNVDKEPRNDNLVEGFDNNKNNKELFQITFNDLQKLSDDLLVLSSNKEQNIIPKEVEDQNEANVEEINDESKPKFFTEPTSKSELAASHEENEKLPTDKACNVDFDAVKVSQKSAQESKSLMQNEDRKDMSVEASAPTPSTLPALLDPLNPLNLNEELGTSLLRLNPLDPLKLSEKLGSPILPNIDPLNINEKLRSSVFPDLTPLNINEQLATSILPKLDPLNLNEKLGSAMLDPLNLNGKLDSILQPNLDPLNVRSSLQDIIVQPTIPDDPVKFLGKPVAEVLKLPTLEDLRERLSNLFDNNDRSAENNFSDEDGDCTNDAPVEMAPAASTRNLQRVPLRPLENNINLDILQLNPLSKQDLLSNAPKLNINNFRAKLPIPNNLDLKPAKLESRVGNNKGNVLGAALTSGKDKTILRKSKPSYSNPLSHPIGTLPSLDELRSTLETGTQNLLNTPRQPSLDLFRDSNLRSSGIPDIDEIRKNAEKTMKGLQQRMKSTLKGGHINPLSEKFVKPQDFLDDVNDKLKAIHYDLNDRLSSIHDNILDQSKHLAIPALPSFPINRNADTNIMKSIRNRGKPARLLTSASKISTQELNPLENKNDRTLSPTKTSSKRVQANRKPLLGAESAPVATKVEFPKSAVSPKKISLPSLPHLHSLTQAPANAFLQNRQKPILLPRQPGFVKDLNRPILRKPSPFKDKNGKVTITFATTTPSPVTSPMNQFRTPSLKDKPSLKQNSNLIESLTQPKSNVFDDGRQSASEQSRITSSKSNFKIANSDKKNLPQLQDLDSTENTKPRLSNFKTNKDFKLRHNENNSNKLNTAWAFDNKADTKNAEVLAEQKAKPLWPKSDEESFLAKVRQAMQTRLNNFHPAKAENTEVANIERHSPDMLKSASESKDIIDEPLKENVSYKCKMVCTRE